MYVVKRDGRQERVMFDKITARINKLAYELDHRYIDTAAIAQKARVQPPRARAGACRRADRRRVRGPQVVAGMYQGVKTSDLDILAAETAAYLTTQHPDYAILAARIAVSNLHKETKKRFSEVMAELYTHISPVTGRHAPLLSDEVHAAIQANADRLDSAIIYDRDYAYNYFGFKTLEKSYLMRIGDRVVERPQHMLMRVRVDVLSPSHTDTRTLSATVIAPLLTCCGCDVRWPLAST
jgi:hypothetical protein